MVHTRCLWIDVYISIRINWHCMERKRQNGYSFESISRVCTLHMRVSLTFKLCRGMHIHLIKRFIQNHWLQTSLACKTHTRSFSIHFSLFVFGSPRLEINRTRNNEMRSEKFEISFHIECLFSLFLFWQNNFVIVAQMSNGNDGIVSAVYVFVCDAMRLTQCLLQQHRLLQENCLVCLLNFDDVFVVRM